LNMFGKEHWERFVTQSNFDSSDTLSYYTARARIQKSESRIRSLDRHILNSES
jgi:hypothetical protein